MKTIIYYELSPYTTRHAEDQVFEEIGLTFETPESALERYKLFLENNEDKNWYVKIITGSLSDVELIDVSLGNDCLEFTYSQLTYNDPPMTQYKTVVVDGETYTKSFTPPYEKKIIDRSRRTKSIQLYEQVLKLR